MALNTSDIQSKLQTAFDGPLASAVKDFIYTSIDNEPTYDPTTGMTKTDVDITGLSGAFVGFTVEEIKTVNTSGVIKKERIRRNDIKLIVLQNVLTVEPKEGDVITLATGKTYTVIAYSQDPFSVEYEIHLRTMKNG